MLHSLCVFPDRSDVLAADEDVGIVVYQQVSEAVEVLANAVYRLFQVQV